LIRLLQLAEVLQGKGSVNDDIEGEFLGRTDGFVSLLES
jgi:hypothetical protein